MLFLSVLVGSNPARAQTYNWKPVQIHGGGFVSGKTALALKICS